jgi:CIC family chloride channel protein
VAAFAPIVLASVTGTAISRAWFGDFPAFILPTNQLGSLWELPVFALLGLASALIAVIFIRSIFLVADLFKSWAPRAGVPPWAWPGVAGLGIGLIALVFPQVLGVGYELTDMVLQGDLPFGMLAALLLAKLLATALSLGSGFSGGVFSPALAVGALTGGVFGPVVEAMLPALASSPGTYVTVGMGAVAGAVLGAPISTILIVFEMTADYGVTTAVMIGTVTAAMLMSRLTGRSFFQLQLERRGLSAAPAARDGGSRMPVRIGDIMREPDHVVAVHACLDAILPACRHAPGGQVLVTDGDSRLIGILFPVDLATALAEGAGGITSESLACPDIPVLEACDEARAALASMANRDVILLPVVDARQSRRLVGIVYERDIHRAIARADQAATIRSAA